MHAHGILSHLDCESGSLKLHFEDSGEWETAQSNWGVGTQTGYDKRDQFVVIVGHNQCQSPWAAEVSFSHVLHGCYQVPRSLCQRRVLSLPL